MNDKKLNFTSLTVRPWGFLSSFGVIASLSTIIGFFGRYWWFFDLFSHFRLQYGVGLFILAVLFFLGRKSKEATIFILMTILNMAFILPLYFGKTESKSNSENVFKAMLINVNTQNRDVKRVRNVIEKENPDILVLEEINSRWLKDLEWIKESHPYSVLRPREDNFGIGLFSKLQFDKNEIVYIGEAQVPSIYATFLFKEQYLHLLATHPLPPRGEEYSKWRNDQLEKLPEYIDSSKPFLLLGDLNITPWNYYFKKLLKETGLIDSSKGRGIHSTWPNFHPLFRIPIDHCLHSSNILILNKEIGPDVGSDHLPVIVEFVFRGQPLINLHRN